MKLKDITFGKAAVFINCLVPFLLLLWDFWRDQLGADPIAFATRATGILTLVFLLLTLAVTPARRIFGFNNLAKYRRTLGLYAFFYSAVHVLIYLWFDQSFNFPEIARDTWQRPFVAVGMFSFFLMIPLAVTSTNGMIRKLGGRRWNRLHKLAYIIPVGGIVHYYLIVKSDTRLPLLFAALLVLLLGYRFYAAFIQPKLKPNPTVKSPIPPRS